MQQQNYKKLSKDQYIDLNVKIQKSLILDFDENSAYESAEQAMSLRGQSEAKVAFYKDKNNYLRAHERN